MKASGYKFARFVCACLLAGMLVTGCGDGGNPAGSPAGTARTISGNSSKGPLAGAVVRAWAIDARGQKTGLLLGETQTDASGNWSMTLASGNEPLLIESSGGSYVDEADPAPVAGQRRTVQLGSDDVFAAVLPGGSSTVAINIYTDALLRKSRYETEGENFFAVYALNRSFLLNAFGFDIATTPPADPIQPDAGASLGARQYAMALGGIANVVNALAIANQLPAPTYMVIAALMDDMTDCMVDGHGVNGPVQGVTTLAMDLNAEILRFRNNNFSAYASTPLLQLDQSQCARSGLLPDNIAPTFIVFPNDFTVESPDGQGIAATAATVQRALQDVEAVDDRDGPVAVVSNLPDFLPLGTTTLTFSASDAAGNSQTASLTATVVAPESPTIIAPRDIIIRAEPDLPVFVELGQPTVSDNVTVAANLAVTNDAPASGFRRGYFVVVWTVTDEVGLSAQAQQRIFVGVSPGTEQTAGNFDPGRPYDGSGEIFLAPIQRPGTTVARLPDADLDGLPDILELQLGTDFNNIDTDADGLEDAFEVDLGTSPAISTPVVDLAAGVKGFSLPEDSGIREPRVVRFAEGAHDRLELHAPCDNLVLAGAGSGATLRSIRLHGCNGVLVYRVDVTRSGATLRLVDSSVTLRESRITDLLLVDSAVYLEASQVSGSVTTAGETLFQADCDSEVMSSAGNSVQRNCPAD